jgi:hypothetical protein
MFSNNLSRALLAYTVGTVVTLVMVQNVQTRNALYDSVLKKAR